jgi:FAD/FMN-containing dehydrogenase
VAKGIVPVALEMLDRPTIEIVEAGAQAAGYPRNAEAVLLVELDGAEAEIDRLGGEVESICVNRGAQEFTAARSDEDRLRLWKGRKAAFGAMGRISTDLYVQDGSVPRSRLPEVLARVAEIGKRLNIQIANVFHVGDGNLHPCIPYDGRDEDERKRVFAAGREIMELCISVGGCISGEHGIGTEKADFMPLMFSESDLRLMRSLHEAWDPKGLCNPGKIFPTSPGCGEKAPLSSGQTPSGAWI